MQINELHGMSLNEIDHATQLLVQWQCRDQHASQELLTHAYQDIRAIISKLVENHRPSDTMLQDSSVTELANESIVKLHKWRNDETPIENRRDFFEYVRISVWHLLFGKPHHQLINEQSEKQACIAQLKQILPSTLSYQFELNQDLFHALEEMRTHYPRQYDVFELKNFAMVSHEQIADILEISQRTVDNDIKFSRMWLRKRLTH